MTARPPRSGPGPYARAALALGAALILGGAAGVPGDTLRGPRPAPAPSLGVTAPDVRGGAGIGPVEARGAYEPLATLSGPGEAPDGSPAPEGWASEVAHALGRVGAPAGDSPAPLDPGPADWRARFLGAVARHGGWPEVADRIALCESRYRPEVLAGTVRGAAGEVGGAQFMPSTLRSVDDLLPALDTVTLIQYTRPEVQGRAMARMMLAGRIGEWTCY